MIGRIIKFLFFVGVIGLIGLIGFAYLGDLRPEQTQMSKPVTLDAN